jgi:hypothetical protein
MTQPDFKFQPGAMLHDAIIGAFRAHGGSFDVWLAENGIPPTSARSVTFGMSKGPKGVALLNRLIDAAGRDVVKAGYMARLNGHVAEVRKAVA